MTKILHRFLYAREIMLYNIVIMTSETVATTFMNCTMFFQFTSRIYYYTYHTPLQLS